MAAAEPIAQTYRDKNKIISVKPNNLNLDQAAEAEFRFMEHAEKVVREAAHHVGGASVGAFKGPSHGVVDR